MKGLTELIVIILIYVICICIAADNQETQNNDTINSSSQNDLNNTNPDFSHGCWTVLRNNVLNIVHNMKITIGNNGHVSTNGQINLKGV